MHNWFLRWLILWVGCSSLLSLLTVSALAQNSQGYYRFQYQKNSWQVYRSRQYNLYFPATFDTVILAYVAGNLPASIAKIRKAAVRQVPEELSIILYPSISQMYESNIGRYQPQSYPFPVFLKRSKRIVVAYNGSNETLLAELEEAIARAVWEAEVKKAINAGSEDQNGIPYWFQEGVVRFFAHGWTIEREDALRRSYELMEFTSWQDVLRFQPRLGGQAFCYFLSQQYSGLAVANTFQQLKDRKTLRRAIKVAVQQPLDTLLAQCFKFYSARIECSKQRVTQKYLPTLRSASGLISGMQFSPDKRFIIYTSNWRGRRTVYVHDISKNARTVLTSYKPAPWLTEHSWDQYPLARWSEDSKNVWVVLPRKGTIRAVSFSPAGERKQTVKLKSLDGLTSLQVVGDDDLLLAAYKNGRSDIVSFNTNSERFSAYTDDSYEDSDPLMINGRRLYFLSNRSDSLVDGTASSRKSSMTMFKQGLFVMDSGKVRGVAVDTIPYSRLRNPVLLDEKTMLLTSAADGTGKDVLVDLQSQTVKVLGMHAPFQYLVSKSELAFFRSKGDSAEVRIEPLSAWQNRQPLYRDTSAWLNDYTKNLMQKAKEDSILKSTKDTVHYFSDDVFAIQREHSKAGQQGARHAAVGRDKQPYILELHSAYFSAQVNNDYFINRYQPYTTYLGQYKFPDITALTRAGLTDLFENHHLSIAYSLPVSTNGSNFFGRYENTGRNVDWSVSYFRKVEQLKPDGQLNWVDENGRKYPNAAKVKTHYYELSIVRPITFYSAISLQAALRYDKTVFVATDRYSLDFAPLKSAWSINTLSYKYQKLKEVAPLLFHGLACSVNVDVCNGFSKDAFVTASTGHVSYHQPVFRDINIVAQVRGGVSRGDMYMLYNFGGKDNNVTPQVDTTVQFGQNEPYAFQTLVAPFRGFKQNSLFGNCFASTNVDVYFPLFYSLIPVRFPLGVINNLQLILLSDFATVGNTATVTGSSRSALWSFGVGARSLLAGYPLRLDVAWPGDIRKQPVWYFTLSL